MTAWVLGIAILIFKHLWNRRWFSLVCGLGLPVHSLLLWVLPNRTPFDVGVSIVIINFELWGLLALIVQFETTERNRVYRHTSRRGI
jgi:hypothetical protein